MSRIAQTFAALKSQNRKALVTFIMACDPGYDRSLQVMMGLPDAGADIIELGMPFSDPAADGLTIQKAGQRALAAGGNMHMTLKMVQQFRSKNTKTPVILMGYANPLYAYGLARFAADAASAGVDGLIIVDLPPEEDGELQKAAASYALDIIRLITPTTDESRLKIILQKAGGFLYYVSITGVTGAAKANLGALAPHLKTIRAQTDLPLVIGFGVKTLNDAQEISTAADGVVVGSAIIEKIIENHEDTRNLEPVFSFVKGLSSALKAPPRA